MARAIGAYCSAPVPIIVASDAIRMGSKRTRRSAKSTIGMRFSDTTNRVCFFELNWLLKKPSIS